MKADEIMHVLRLVALGRINTPQQEEFCEKLAKLMEQGARVVEIPVFPEVADAKPVDPDAEVTVADLTTVAVVPVESVKRTRKQKAD